MENLEKKKHKNPLEIIKNPVEKTLRSCRFLSHVVVECVLNFGVSEKWLPRNSWKVRKRQHCGELCSEKEPAQALLDDTTWVETTSGT